MTSTTMNQCGITFHDIDAQMKEKTISKLIKKYVSNECTILKINMGDTCHKMGREVRRSVYVTFSNSNGVDQLMKNRSDLKLHGELLKVTRTIPKTYSLFDECVSGLKITIDQTNHELSESDLRKYFQRFGPIHKCEWINENQTEALFTFYDHDSVDQIIACNSSTEIKGIKVRLEKTRTAKDYLTNVQSYVVHITNLPLCITSEEISKAFQIPICRILLHPCSRLEQSFVSNGRTTSEAWITNFSDEVSAKVFAQEKTGTFIGKNKIECEAKLESIFEDELCERFQNGRCSESAYSCCHTHVTLKRRPDASGCVSGSVQTRSI